MGGKVKGDDARWDCSCPPIRSDDLKVHANDSSNFTPKLDIRDKKPICRPELGFGGMHGGRYVHGFDRQRSRLFSS